MHRDIPRSPARRLAGYLEARLVESDTPLIVALDGRSGAGKSTTAQGAAALLNAGEGEKPRADVIEGDQFYGGGSAELWEQLSLPERLDRVMDWRRQLDVLRALREEGWARWRCFDWDSTEWQDDEPPLCAVYRYSCAAPLILLDGVYSGRPELADAIDLRVLLKPDEDKRRKRLREREGEDYDPDWERRWSEVEEYYFRHVVNDADYALIL
ncbi:MAG: hypothetical protein AAFX56_07210 [Pseudomonadota bacterium]